MGVSEIRPENLEIVTRLAPGTAVTVVGLVGAAHLNGSTGHCVGWHPESGRWTVGLAGGTEVAVRPDNLVPAARIPRTNAEARAAAPAARARSRSPPGGDGEPLVLTFGRHEGRTYHEVFRMEAGYCEWALRVPHPTGPLRRFQDWLRSQMMRGALPSQAPAPPPIVGWSHRAVPAGAATAWGEDLRAFLGRLPRVPFCAKLFSGSPHPSACPICMEEWEAVTAEIVLTPCFHVFHAPCLGGWLGRRRECPSCRWDVADLGETKAFQSSGGARPGLARPAASEHVDLTGDA